MKALTNVIWRLIAVSLAAALTDCANPAFTVYSPLSPEQKGGTLGYAFTVTSPIRVTNLGVWDYGGNGDGLLEPGTQLIQTTIPAGTSGTLVDGYRYVPIAPVILAPGNYTIGAYYEPIGGFIKERVMSFCTKIASASEISYVGSRSSLYAGFRFPRYNDRGEKSGPKGFFGPNFCIACGDPNHPTVCPPRIPPWTWKTR
jgi:hypothetical protein